MKTNQNKRKTYKCNLCEHTISKDRGKCEYCGWVQQEYLDEPDKIHWSYNFVSFNKAKKLFNEGKAIKPDFDDFLECMQVYCELEFYYNGKQYGVLTDRNNIINFYEWNVMDKGYQTYTTIEEFSQKSNINGTLLKDVWELVEKVGVAS